MNDKKLGGLYGALVGDACGCPYEFKAPQHIPAFDQIDMTPPAGYKRSWKDIPVGTYTDDGAQTLILTELLLRGEPLDLTALHAKLYAWLGGGYMSVDNVTFDSGMQTKQALLYCDSIEEVRRTLSFETNSGNGSLMRSISVGLLAESLPQAMELGAKHTLVTHPNLRCQVACAVYCGIAYEMLHKGIEADDAFDFVAPSFLLLRPDAKDEVTYLTEFPNKSGLNGSGYVVDSFWSALRALRLGKTYEEVIKHAIAFGHDTDTTACIAGGLAGIKFGYSGIPARWLELLRGKSLIEPIAARLG